MEKRKEKLNVGLQVYKIKIKIKIKNFLDKEIYLCEKICKKKKSCAVHGCNEVCCPANSKDDILGNHLCLKVIMNKRNKLIFELDMRKKINMWSTHV